ncbi:hypothetical protein K9M48_04725 [Candidatus Gracilibacteria bacterium]|nr:hypothetical protein [Candidatus Gracilibacteria bacterium]
MNSSDNKKLYRDMKLWMLSHPERDLKLNKELKSKKRELLNLFIKEDGQYFDKDKINEIFKVYSKYNKRIPNYDVFAKFDVNVGFSLKEYVLFLNALFDIYKNIREEILKYTLESEEDTIYTEGEKSLYIDWMQTRFNQYKIQIEMGNIDIRTLMFYFMLKEKLDIKSDLNLDKIKNKEIFFDHMKFNFSFVIDLFDKLEFKI